MKAKARLGKGACYVKELGVFVSEHWQGFWQGGAWEYQRILAE